MKNLFFLCLLLSVGCSRCFDSCNPTPNTNNITCDQSPARYVPNEIILDAQGLGADYGTYKTYLESKGFKKRDSCNCARQLELWGNDNDIDVIGVIKDAKTSTDPTSGSTRLSPNFDITPDLIQRNIQTQQDTPKIVNPAGPHVRIVIVDTGVDPSNSASSMLWHKLGSTGIPCSAEGDYGLNVPHPFNNPLDKQGHGTHINGIVSGIPSKTGNQSGINFELLNVKITPDSTPKGNLFKAVCGLYYGLDRGGQVFNLSWGYTGGNAPELIKSFLEIAKTKNVVIVAGAGNEGNDIDIQKFWPASFSETYKDFVISVGAYNANYIPPTPSSPLYQLYVQTNVGKSVDVYAPGVDIESTYIGGSGARAIASGTSMAAAYVTRVAAIIRGKKPSMSAKDIKDCIMNNSKIETVEGIGARIFDAQKVITACGN